jgi:hypothetical protein
MRKVLTLAVALLIACDQSTSPAPRAWRGVYQLTSVESHPLPVLESTSGSGDYMMYESGSLEITRDSAFIAADLGTYAANGTRLPDHNIRLSWRYALKKLGDTFTLSVGATPRATGINDGQTAIVNMENGEQWLFER